MSIDNDDFELLQAFHELLGTPEHSVPLTEQQLQILSKLAPEPLMRFWKTYGWCTYLGGLIRTVNPNDYLDVLSDWQLEPGSMVFARSAFGDLVCLIGDQLRIIFVHTATCLNSILRYPEFLATQFYPDDIDGFFFGPLYREAVERFGRPAPDEIFTFEPALALGGQADVKHVVRVKLKPALALLAQLVDELQEYT
ncbi:MAG: DUF1851 domain-containing protein [Polyangiaceae bacterium]